jgi:lipopolysaccharide transport system ATP-binding protein
MLVRLVFSMFACFEPDVFVVDEALSVGDLHFQQKCARRIHAMRDAGVTTLFVSHDLAAVDALCDRVMVLHGGRVRFLGEKRQGIATYYELLGASRDGSFLPPAPARPIPTPVAAVREPRDSVAGESIESLSASELASLPWQGVDHSGQLGGDRIDITGIVYRRSDGVFTQCVERGDWLDVFARYEAREGAERVNCGVEVHDRLSQLLFAVNWLNAEIEPLRVNAGDVFYSRFRLRTDLEPGEYGLWLGASQALADPQSHTGWDQHVGGERYVGLPRAGKIAVLPRSDRRRTSFGPANLAYVVQRTDPQKAQNE